VAKNSPWASVDDVEDAEDQREPHREERVETAETILRANRGGSQHVGSSGARRWSYTPASSPR
jgi:hypothetical protein